MPVILHADFETRSAVDLRATGVFIYAMDETTDAWCMAYAFDDEPVELWKLGEPLPDRIRQHVVEGGQVWAHNAQFEWAVWNGCCVKKYGWPKLSITQMVCTAAMAAAQSLPRALAKAAPAVKLKIEKDMKGHNIMMQMAKPRKRSPLTWWDVPEKMEVLYSYCRQDIEVERALGHKLARLAPREQQIWHLDQKINARGVKIDRRMIHAVKGVVDTLTPKLDAQMRKITDHDVGGCNQIAKLLKWVNAQGVKTEKLNKESLVDLFEKDLPDNVEAALRLREEAGKVSTAKLESMLDAASADDRIRGVFMYHAAGTGRWSSLRVQLHNMPRSKIKFKDVEYALELYRKNDVASINVLYGSPIHTASDCLRGMLIADNGRRLMAADFANIEGRVLAVLAGQDDLIETFRNDGPIYENMGAAIFGIPVESVTKDGIERQLGKKAVLGCGYQMGKNKFYGTCKAEGMPVTRELAELAVDTYRSENNRIKALWYEIEEVAIAAVRTPGTAFKLDGTKDWGVRFRKKGSFLQCRLPSGRIIYYNYPRIVQKETPWGEMRDGLVAYGVNSITQQFEEYSLYGGILVENLVQATARDLLAEAMLRIEAAGYPVVLHVHDEIVSEVPDGFGTLNEFIELMSVRPAWAEDWPIAVTGWEGHRYRK